MGMLVIIGTIVVIIVAAGVLLGCPGIHGLLEGELDLRWQGCANEWLRSPTKSLDLLFKALSLQPAHAPSAILTALRSFFAGHQRSFVTSKGSYFGMHKQLLGGILLPLILHSARWNQIASLASVFRPVAISQLIEPDFVEWLSPTLLARCFHHRTAHFIQIGTAAVKSSKSIIDTVFRNMVISLFHKQLCGQYPFVLETVIVDGVCIRNLREMTVRRPYVESKSSLTYVVK
jgi:hypothetical protein